MTDKISDNDRKVQPEAKNFVDTAAALINNG